MRKTFIAVFAAALLLAAVICTAGCVTAPSEPFIGTWSTEVSDTETGFLIVSEDNTGRFAIVKEIVSGSAEPEYKVTVDLTCTWEKNTDGTYSVKLSDGKVYINTLGPHNATFTGNDEKGTVFMRYPSEMSGSTLEGLGKAQKALDATQGQK